jgi:hypothetical protein
MIEHFHLPHFHTILASSSTHPIAPRKGYSCDKVPIGRAEHISIVRQALPVLRWKSK